MLVGYARVSTLDQNPDLQRDALIAAGCEKIFEERVSSGKERPELLRAIDFCRSGDVLIVWKLDRLARSTQELLKTAEQLAGKNIGLRCLTQPIDTTSPGGRLVFTIFAAIAEFERDLIRERTHAGLRAAIARGRKGGRPPALSDKQKAMARVLLENPDLSVRDVAAQLQTTVPTLYRYFPGGKGSLLREGQTAGLQPDP